MPLDQITSNDRMKRNSIILGIPGKNLGAIDLTTSSARISSNTPSLGLSSFGARVAFTPRTLILTASELDTELAPRVYGFSSPVGGGRVLESMIENEHTDGKTLWRVGLYRDLDRQVQEYMQAGKEPTPDIYFGNIVAQEPDLVKCLHDKVMSQANGLTEDQLAQVIMSVSRQIGLEFQAECEKA